MVAVAKEMKIRLHVNGKETGKLWGEHGWAERGCSCLGRKRPGKMKNCGMSNRDVAIDRELTNKCRMIFMIVNTSYDFQEHLFIKHIGKGCRVLVGKF